MNHNEINVRSTDVNRTLQSAASQLTGLYPMGRQIYLYHNLINMNKFKIFFICILGTGATVP